MTADDIDRAALLAAILADPADDLPRLAFADWCEENGEADRAEIIRWQLVNRLEWKAAPGGTMVFALADREDYRGCPICPAHPDVSLTMCRGFISAANCPLAAWLRHGPALVREHPVERVEVSDRRPANNVFTYRWWCRAHSSPSNLPLDVFDMLIGGKKFTGRDGEEWRDYHGGEGSKYAIIALSSALIAWAKASLA